MTKTTMVLGLAAAALLTAVPALAAPDDDPDSRESYSYVRALDGRATLASQGAGPGEDAELNQPLLTGDTVRVARGARVEIALADRSLLRVGGDTVLGLTRIAFSGDADARSTRLDIERGEVVLVVGEDALGDQLPELHTPGAEVLVHQPGTYRVETDGAGWTEVVVREGYAEVVTERGSAVVRGDEAAWTEGGYGRVELAAAGPLDALERWGDELWAEGERAAGAELYVEPELAYQAAPLARYGSWVTVDSVAYWRPYVAVGWRPYWQGRWHWTPSGMTWVSYEPWGWVPYHYGSWSRLPTYGWVWRPGHLYSPAWVYWHWSDDWVGWIPTGYYTHWYDPFWGGYGFRWGFYGWAGGHWGYYNDWSFRHTRRICDRDWRRWHRHGHDLARELPEVPHGIVTTDTGGLPRDRFGERGVARRELLRRSRYDDGSAPDVTDFVARKRDLPERVAERVRPSPGDRRQLERDRDAVVRSERDRSQERVNAARTRSRDDGEIPDFGARGRGGIDLGRDRDRTVPATPAPRRGDTRTERGDTRTDRSDTRTDRGDDATRAPRGRLPEDISPGERVRVRPTPVPRTETRPRSEAPTDDRQGWRSREPRMAPPAGRSSGDERRNSRSSGTLRRDSRDAGDVRRDSGAERRRDSSYTPAPRRPVEPVQRVLGGIRRGESGSGRSREIAPIERQDRYQQRYERPDRYQQPERYDRPRSTGPAAPSSRVRPSTPSSPRYQPPASRDAGSGARVRSSGSSGGDRSSSVRSGSAGRDRPSSVRSGSSSSGRSRSESRGSSSRSSSPPPRRDR